MLLFVNTIVRPVQALRSPRFGSAACVSTFGVTAVGTGHAYQRISRSVSRPTFPSLSLTGCGKKIVPAGWIRLRWLRQSHWCPPGWPKEMRTNGRPQAPMASALGNVTFVNGFPVPVFATNKCLISFRTMAHYHSCLTFGICLSADLLVSVFASQYLKKLSLSAHFAYQCLEMGAFCKVFVRSNVFVTAFRILVGNPCP